MYHTYTYIYIYIYIYIDRQTTHTNKQAYTALSGELMQGITHCLTDARVLLCLSTWGLLNSLGTVALLKVAVCIFVYSCICFVIY